MELQGGSKIVPYVLLSLCTLGTYFSPLETEPTVILNEHAVKQVRGEPWLIAWSNDELLQNEVEAVVSVSVLRKNVNLMLSETCSVHRTAVHNALLQPLVLSIFASSVVR